MTRTDNDWRPQHAAHAAAVLHDVWCEATTTYWLIRAEQLDAARPRPGDFHGRATRQQLAARDARLAEAAAACRHRAELAEASRGEVLYGRPDHDFAATLSDVATAGAAA